MKFSLSFNFHFALVILDLYKNEQETVGLKQISNQ